MPNRINSILVIGLASLMLRVVAAQVCDATDDDSSTTAGYIIVFKYFIALTISGNIWWFLNNKTPALGFKHSAFRPAKKYLSKIISLILLNHLVLIVKKTFRQDEHKP